MLNTFYALVFISELVLWFGVGKLVYLFAIDYKRLSYLVALVAVAIIIVIWSRFFSPKAAFRLTKLPRTIIISLMSLSVGFGLYLKGDKTLGMIILTAVTIVQIVGQYFLAEN